MPFAIGQQKCDAVVPQQTEPVVHGTPESVHGSTTHPPEALQNAPAGQQTPSSGAPALLEQQMPLSMGQHFLPQHGFGAIHFLPANVHPSGFTVVGGCVGLSVQVSAVGSQYCVAGLQHTNPVAPQHCQFACAPTVVQHTAKLVAVSIQHGAVVMGHGSTTPHLAGLGTPPIRLSNT